MNMKMKLFTALALVVTVATAAAANEEDGALPSLRNGLIGADLVYVAANDVDIDASSNQNDAIVNQANADEIEKKNDVPKYLRGIQLEESCDEVYDDQNVCDRENGKYVSQYCRVISRKSRSSPRYRDGFCENGNLICCT